MKDATVIQLTKVALAAFWGGVFVFALVGSTPDNPHRFSERGRVNLIAVLPEGWAFFTRDPKEPDYYVYQRSGAELTPVGVTNADPSNLFGLVRNLGTHSIQLAMLLQRIPESAWHPCESAPEVCLNDPAITDQVWSVSNPFLHPTLCGPLLARKQAPVPWAWGASRETIIMPSELLALDVSCTP